VIDDFAFRLTKLAAKLPRGGAAVARKATWLRPGLHLHPVQTRYGTVYCDLSESACWPLVKFGEYPHWRPDEEAWARIPLNRESVVIDVGANIGVMAKIFAERVKHVHAFEPAPRALRLLIANSAPNVTVHAVALSNREGTAKFNERTALDESCLSDDGIDVPVRTLDSFGLKPDLIKIDVEGFEHQVLQGATETLKHSPVVMFEALTESSREYCEKIILGANPNYRLEPMGGTTNHLAWPTVGAAQPS
jgi:FkbM family methyltransferase